MAAEQERRLTATGTDDVWNGVFDWEWTVMPFPKVGQPNSEVRIGVVDVASGETRWMDVSLESDLQLHDLGRGRARRVHDPSPRLRVTGASWR